VEELLLRICPRQLIRAVVIVLVNLGGWLGRKLPGYWAPIRGVAYVNEVLT